MSKSQKLLLTDLKSMVALTPFFKDFEGALLSSQPLILQSFTSSLGPETLVIQGNHRSMSKVCFDTKSFVLPHAHKLWLLTKMRVREQNNRCTGKCFLGHREGREDPCLIPRDLPHHQQQERNFQPGENNVLLCYLRHSHVWETSAEKNQHFQTSINAGLLGVTVYLWIQNFLKSLTELDSF